MRVALRKHRWRSIRRLGRAAAIVFAALFALQASVAVAHTHLNLADAPRTDAAAADLLAGGDAPNAPEPVESKHPCETCLAAAALAHAPPSSAIEPALPSWAAFVFAVIPDFGVAQSHAFVPLGARAPPISL